jgi:hypothetical protein
MLVLVTKKKMAKLTKKVEKLRALLVTEKQCDELINNLDKIDNFTQEDKSLMESFKRIFHKGLSQLNKFIQDLEEKGKELDEYSILYYTKQIINSPFSGEAEKIAKNKTYWKPSPDILGITGNLNKSSAQTPLDKLLDTEEPTTNTNVVSLTKIPKHMFDNMRALELASNSIQGFNIIGSVELDNFLSNKPLNYNPNNKTPHGSFYVKDTDSWDMTKAAAPGIYKKLEEDYLGKEDYRLFLFKRTYNPNDPEENTNLTENQIVEYKIPYEVEGVTTFAVISGDLCGNTFESDGVREYSINISTPEKDVKTLLHTLSGQLGGILPIKKRPISS